MAKKINYLQPAGSLGLDIMSGHSRSDQNYKLDGSSKKKIFAEMRDNNAVIGAVLYAVKMMIQGVTWTAIPKDLNNDDDVKAAEFISENFDRANTEFKKFIEQALSMLVFGWSIHELIFEKRDGKLMLKTFGFRPQKTIERWLMEGYETVYGFEQLTPGGKSFSVPLNKCIHLIVSDFDGSPEGRSILRSAYRAWYFVKNIENHEAIRIERDAVGVPVARIPMECLANDATGDKKSIKASFEKVVANLRNDEQAGVVIPSDRDEAGNLLFDIDLIRSSGSTQIDTNTIIQRYNTQILMSMLADFMQLGHESVGSFALSSDKTNLFGQALGGILNILNTGIEDQIIKVLLEINGLSGAVKMTHSDVEKLDMKLISEVISSLSQSGMIFDDHATEAHVRKLLDLPEREDDDDFDLGVSEPQLTADEVDPVLEADQITEPVKDETDADE